MKVGDKVVIKAFDLDVGECEGIIRRMLDENHRCAAVEITKPGDFHFGHDCDGVTPPTKGWNCFVEELEVVE
jgi:hypothetical protein